MIDFATLSLVQPWALAILVVLPGLFFLLKLIPPSPIRVSFPPIRFLLRLKNHHETPAQAPWWLLLLRLLIFILLVLAASGPVNNATRDIRGAGPLYLIVDNGWASAAGWSKRVVLIDNLLAQAKREGRAVGLVATAPEARKESPQSFQLISVDDAKSRLRELQPRPWSTDRLATLKPLLAFAEKSDGQPGHVFWLGDDLAGRESDKDLLVAMEKLKRLGAMTIVSGNTSTLGILRPPLPEGDSLGLVVDRADKADKATWYVRALSVDGRLLARKPVDFTAGQGRGKVSLVLPAEHRNQLARLEIEKGETAASSILIDERWRRRPVGLVADGRSSKDASLLSGYYYLERAFQPLAEVRKGSVDDLLSRNLAIMVMLDAIPVEGADLKKVEDWVRAGGVLVRFAGPKLSETGSLPSDDLIPVRLRTGTRVLGGSLAWRSRAKVGAIKPESPFGGLAIPEDVRISKQVLAHPSLELEGKTWVTLEDGTPLVTAEKKDKGWSLLFHVTANADWSSLPMSGLFVEMMERLLGLSQGIATTADGPPYRLKQALDGFGTLRETNRVTGPITAADFNEAKAGPDHPPGLYGRGQERRALNLSASLPGPRLMTVRPDQATGEVYGEKRETDLAPALVSVALILFFIDFLISLSLRGVLRKPALTTSALLIGLLVLYPTFLMAADHNKDIPLAALEPRLAYVKTGNPLIDQTSKVGLWGLGIVARQRTAAELADPVGINVEQDELAFYPLIYWPLEAAPVALSDEGAKRVNAYMRQGGTILFDTLEQGDSSRHQGLASLIDKLDIPPLQPVWDGHVLGRSFYLLSSFPGRWTGADIWVERRGSQANDGVSPVVVGSHDWAGAWAMDDGFNPLFPVVPGGDRQREMAFRFGINLLMYALTGNYKADQVHLPTIMKRLGR